MPQVPRGRYPSVLIWDKLISILTNDDYFCNTTDGKLYRRQANDLALYSLPLMQQTDIFSDLDYAVGIYNDNNIDIIKRNSLNVDIHTFFIDVAYRNEDVREAIINTDKLCRDIIYTLDLIQNLDGLGIISPHKTVRPTEAVPLKQMFLFISTIQLSIEVNSIYR
jgi:hypothetical protein